MNEDKLNKEEGSDDINSKRSLNPFNSTFNKFQQEKDLSIHQQFSSPKQPIQIKFSDQQRSQNERASDVKHESSHYKKSGMAILQQMKVQQKASILGNSNNQTNLKGMLGKKMLLKIIDKDQEKDGIFQVHGKRLKLERKSLNLFNSSNFLRKQFVWLLTSKWFDFLILLFIFMNTIVFAIYDYSQKNTQLNQILNILDYVFTGIFILEAFIKIIALGLVLHKNSYLRDSWNILDFIVISLGIFSFIPGVPNLKAFRAVRVIRPLRTINTIPGMKLLVSSLLKSLPQMWNVIVFLLFVILIFGIFGVQLFQGVVYSRCRLTSSPVSLNYWPIDYSQPLPCGGNYQCLPGTYCGSPEQYNIPLDKDNVTLNANINYGLSTFDNIFSAMEFIFCMMTCDGWTQDMYNYMDGGIAPMAYVYFPFLEILLAFFLMNYFLAIIMNTFEKMQKKIKQQAKIQRKQDAKVQEMLEIARRNLDKGENSNTKPFFLGKLLNNQNDKLPTEQSDEASSIAQNLKLLQQKGKEQKEALEKQNQFQNSSDQEDNEEKEQKERLYKKLQQLVEIRQGLLNRAKSRCFYNICFKIAEHSLFEFIIIVVLLLNTIFLALNSYPQDKKVEQIQDLINNIFFAIFFIEMLIKIGAFGFKYYCKDKFNIFDALVVIISLIDIVISLALTNKVQGQKAILAFRSFRLLRIIKLAKSWKQLQYLLTTITESLTQMGSFTCLLLLFILIYILFALEMFANEIKFNSEGIVDRINGESPFFNCDSFLNAFLTIFIVLTQDGWRAIMYQFVLARGKIAYFFFISFIMVGQMILLNLFIAILLDNFDMTQSEELEDNLVSAYESNSKNKKKNQVKEIFLRVSNACKRKFESESKYKVKKKPIPDIEVEIVDDESNENQSQTKLQANEGDFYKIGSQKQKGGSGGGVALSEQNEQTEQQDENKMIEKKIKQRFQRRIQRLAFSKKRGLANYHANQRLKKNQNSNQDQLKQQGKVSIKDKLAMKFQYQIQENYIKKKLETNFQGKQDKVIKRKLEGNAFFILKSTNCLRKTAFRILESKYFQGFILFTIMISSMVLVLDNPLNDPDTKFSYSLNLINIILTSIFSIECILNILAFGLLFNGRFSYFRQIWNILDFSIIVTSIINLSIKTGSSNLKVAKVFRLLRVLRPLRVISRNDGLKLSLSAMFHAVPNIINAIFIQFLFLMIFGIIGVSFFKGSFYSCSFGSHSNSNSQLDRIINKFDCLNMGGEWVNNDYNFDNVVNAILSLYSISTTDNWSLVMYQATSITGIGLEPKPNSSVYNFAYFVIFMIGSNFFIWNLFVGIVISTFNQEKDKLGKNYLLTEHQRNWIKYKQKLLQVQPLKKKVKQENKCREKVRKLVNSKKFEIVIFTCIVMNTIILAIDWYGSPPEIQLFQDISNYIFTSIFMIECIVKIIGLGFRAYIIDSWNMFDFFIALGGLVSIISYQLTHVKFIRVALVIRTFKIARILRLVKRAKSLKMIFETFIVSLPAISNVGALLMLFVYMYAVLGVQLFAEIKLQQSLEIHANFQNFGTALLTLIRCWTGESWDNIMNDVTRQYSILFQCIQNPSYQDYINKGETVGCGNSAGYVFFMSFMVLIPFSFVNLFIAIILQGLDDTQFFEKMVIQDDDIEKFQKVWKKFDPQGVGLIKVNELPLFLLELGEPLGWEDSYRNNVLQQEDFLVELNINTYNDFKHYLFWDVLAGISKIQYIVQQIEEISKDEDKSLAGNENDKNFLLKMELEFEHQDPKNIQQIEQMKKIENKYLKERKLQNDEIYSSCHFKAGRLLYIALKANQIRKSQSQQLKEENIGKEDEISNEKPSNVQGDGQEDISGLIDGFEREIKEIEQMRKSDKIFGDNRDKEKKQQNDQESLLEDSMCLDDLNETKRRLVSDKTKKDSRDTSNQLLELRESKELKMKDQLEIEDEFLEEELKNQADQEEEEDLKKFSNQQRELEEFHELSKEYIDIEKANEKHLNKKLTQQLNYMHIQQQKDLNSLKEWGIFNEKHAHNHQQRQNQMSFEKRKGSLNEEEDQW